MRVLCVVAMCAAIRCAVAVDDVSLSSETIFSVKHAGLQAICIDERGESLATAGRDAIRIWNITTGEVESRVPTHQHYEYWNHSFISGTTDMLFSPIGLITSGKDGNINIWDLKSRSLLRTIGNGFLYEEPSSNAHRFRRVPINGIAIRTDDTMIAACVKNTVCVWDYTNGQIVKTFGNEHVTLSEFQPERSGFQPDKGGGARKFFAWNGNGALTRWDNSSNIENLHSVRFSLDGKWILAAGSHCVYVWNWETEELAHEIETASCVSPSTDGNVFCGSMWKGLRALKLGPLKMTPLIESRISHLTSTSDGGAMGFDGHRVYAYDKELALQYWADLHSQASPARKFSAQASRGVFALGWTYPEDLAEVVRIRDNP